MARALVFAAALTVSACGGLPAGPTYASDLTVLSWSEPGVVLDSVAAWASRQDDLAIERAGPTLVIRATDGNASESVVDARPGADGYSEVTVSSRYGSGSAPGLRDLGAQMVGGGAFGAGRAVAVPVEPRPGCSTVEEWIAEGPPAPGAPSVEAADPEPVGGLAEVLRRVEYPAPLRRAGIGGVVLVQFVVTETGAVDCAEVVSSPDPGLSEAALRAVEASRFAPADRVRLSIPVSFQTR